MSCDHRRRAKNVAAGRTFFVRRRGPCQTGNTEDWSSDWFGLVAGDRKLDGP